MSWRIGVDSGGTFTDIYLFNQISGEVVTWKTPSTPDDPSRAIMQAISQGLLRAHADSADVQFLGHGTTVGTNTLIQHHGARTGLITTEGFRDLLEIGRQKRPSLYDLQADKPKPLVDRDLRLTVRERCRHDGTVETPLDTEGVYTAARLLRAAEVEAVAICFLYSFQNSLHECLAKEIVESVIPTAFVCASHEVAPEFREYERMSTTVVNAYLGPSVSNYMKDLSRQVSDYGICVKPLVTQSNGGVIGLKKAVQLPVRTILSGPSTGVVAAQAIGAITGIDDLITLDMGGTSSDVAILTGGRCELIADTIVGGYPIKAPMLDIHTVGAGGGSIALVDSGGLLKVGPDSAGSVPGPACYGGGNNNATITDANVVLQTLNPEYLLGGRLHIQKDLATLAIGQLAEKLGLDLMTTADGIIAVAIANMAKIVRVVSVQRGYDPRNYALIAFGGAGPLHAARLARELGIKQIIIPQLPGTQCAMGLLMTDLLTNISLTQVETLSDASVSIIQEVFNDLANRAVAWFDAEEIELSSRQTKLTVDMRYRGQNYELPVTLPEGPINTEVVDVLAKRFAEAHQRLYGFSEVDDEIQLVTFRIEAVGIVPKASVKPSADCGPDASGAIKSWRDVWFTDAQNFTHCPIYARGELSVGNQFDGPAIIEQDDTTTVVLAGMSVRVDPYLNLILEEK